MATSYATLTDLRTHTGIPASGSDTILQAMLDAAARVIDSYCTGVTHTDEYFKAGGSSVTETHSGRRSRSIRLRRRPVLTISSVSIDSSVIDSTLYALRTDGGGGWLETVDWSDQNYNPRIWRGDLTSPWLWPTGSNNISVTYTYGYSDVPDAVAKACALLAKQFYDSDQRNGVTAESYGPVAKSYGTGSGFQITGAAAALLAPYVTHEVGW